MRSSNYSALSSDCYRDSPSPETDSDDAEDPQPPLRNTISTSSYLTYPINYAVNGVLRRLSTELNSPLSNLSHRSSIYPSSSSSSNNLSNTNNSNGVLDNPFSRQHSASSSSIYATSPRLTLPPFSPPPLSPLILSGYRESTPPHAQILSRLLAEEIRLLVPTRLELVERWNLAFSLEQDGSSLKTLYQKCGHLSGMRVGFVVVVKDGGGNVFGAYLNEPPRPSNGHYYGTGECFLWRSTVLSSIPTLASLPPPPSADTTHAQRMTTLGSGGRRHGSSGSGLGGGSGSGRSTPGASGRSTPERIRFKAFPYSGMNDYMILCEQGFLSVGGGDGHYGLWLDSSLENGISSSCPTFGNEPLSDEGQKFDIIGVEIWYIGT